MLIVMAGLPATGKSTLAVHLAQRLPAILLNKDVIRAALFPPSAIEYSTRQDDFCMHVMLQTAEYLLQKDPATHLILDGRTFSQHYQRVMVVAWAELHQVPWKMIECVCREETARQRLTYNTAQHIAANRSFELYQALQKQFEPIKMRRLVVNTDEDLARCVDRCLTYVTSP